MARNDLEVAIGHSPSLDCDEGSRRRLDLLEKYGPAGEQTGLNLLEELKEETSYRAVEHGETKGNARQSPNFVQRDIYSNDLIESCVPNT
jgi:hypothetical protein